MADAGSTSFIGAGAVALRVDGDVSEAERAERRSDSIEHVEGQSAR